MIAKEEIESRSEELAVGLADVQRDYIFGWILSGIYSVSDLGKYLILKGGNCFRKAYFDSTRYSPDLDFASTQSLSHDFITSELNRICEFIQQKTGVQFVIERTRVEDKKRADPETSSVEARLYFKDFYGETNSIVISIRLDITQFGKIHLPIQTRNLIHPYSDSAMCSVSIKCLKLEEMLASKLKCLLQRRHSADLYDFVAATFFRPTVAIERSEIMSVFLQMTIFGSGPGIIKDLLTNLPFESIRPLWEQYLVYPKDAEIEFDNAVDGLKDDVVAIFGGLPLVGGGYQFFPPQFRNPIMEAGFNFTRLRVIYDGLEREVEPYSLIYKIRRDGVAQEYLYVYDLTGGRSSGPGIKSFVHSHIQDITNTDIKFDPRFEVELRKAGEHSGDQFFHGRPSSKLWTYSSDKPFTVECPICGKQFRRKHSSVRLNPHKDRYGNNCVGRVGFLV
jgi:predicted nucleotidyltransferase component of viral defense system